jgi:type I restriction enzyme S subunit
MSYNPLGDHIKLIDIRNKDLLIKNLLGINILKNFMPSVANISGVDLSKYKIIKKNQFAMNLMHVGRDEKLPISFYTEDDPAILSPAYLIFEVLDKKILLPEYLMLQFMRPEFDRLTWFYCDSSIRGGLEWDRFQEIKIFIPNINEQLKYVNIYNGLKKNQKTYQDSLPYLQFICDTYMENLITDYNPEVLSPHIELVNERNLNDKISFVQGISISKKFIKTKANMSGVMIDDYKIVRRGNFAFNPNTARMGEKICIALNSSEPCLVSKIYPVFKIKDQSKLLEEYLLLWFTRAEFDRYVRFHSWGSARETFNWDDMCDVKLPIPELKVQKAIVTIYHALETRKRINQKLKNSINHICHILIKGSVDSLSRPVFL